VVRVYLTEHDVSVEDGCIAIACPITGDWVAMTNHTWAFSIEEMKNNLGFAHLEIINDFTAVSMAIPMLKPEHLIQFGGTKPVEGKPIAAHGDLGMVTPQDVVIALSNSGESNEILALIPVLKRLHVQLICVTSRPESSMARAADVHLCVKVPKEACPLGLAPTSSTTAALVMGDALAVALLEARGFTAEDFALSHPGGALGRKLLLRVNDIMHTGEEIPHVSKDAPLRDALLEITRKNLGMTVICDETMKIEGIFTDGDLRRVFDMGVDVRTLGIADVMTTGGIRVRPGTLAVDVLNLMQSRHITSVMVADGDQLLGVVHMHDLLRAGVV
jgi:arabinose-5-phosphate isomerase